ncbi:MAG: undecaprenyl-diphosphate phosphatase [Planctomyces sp.]
MNLIYAVILGAVQGVAEFLPISSSGHLVIVGELLTSLSGRGLPEWLQGMTMNVALHFGTLLSIATVYFRDLLGLLKQVRLLLLIVLSSVPAGIVGLLFKDQLEALFQNALAAGICLLGTAIILLTARRLRGVGRGLTELSPAAALTIGVFQAVAILPGISRAGSTVGAGLMCGLRPHDAAKYSFFLAVPAIGGASLLELLKLLREGDSAAPEVLPMLAGMVVSYVVGVLSLRSLIRLLAADRLHWFAWYCSAVGLLTIFWQLWSV